MSSREEIENAIKSLEDKRKTLGDSVVDASIAALTLQLVELDGPNLSHTKQRKLATILYVDIVGSTKLVKNLDPEDNMAVVEGALQRLAIPIEEHGGRVTRFLGDGFKSAFGIPIGHENDAEHAVRAGLKIIQASEEYREELKEAWDIQEFKVRVGINTGMVVVGGVTEAEDTVMGAAVNMATRIEQAAPPGGVLISHSTFTHVEGIFEFEELAQIEAKGFDKPVKVYQVGEILPRSQRFYRQSAEGLRSVLVGRETELTILGDTLQEVFDNEECKVLTIAGEAGVGKTRLLFEFDNHLGLIDKKVKIFKGRGRLEYQNSPYGLFRDIFSYVFNIQDSDGTKTLINKVETGFGEILKSGKDFEKRAHTIGHLLGFDFSSSPKLNIEQENAQQLQDLGLKYLGEYLEAVARRSPTLIFLEDIQWADDSSLDLINHLGRVSAGLPLMIICLTRPSLFERRPNWGEGQLFHTRINLQPLSKKETKQLLEGILDKMPDIPTELMDIVVDGAEGNPFYVEELVKMMVEEGVIELFEDEWAVKIDKLAEINIPSTLTGVVQARLDSLPKIERLILQQAAVVGRTFWNSVIEMIDATSKNTNTKEDIATALSSLRKKELIFLRETSKIQGNQEYIFSHAVLRDVTYESVLRKNRKLYHSVVAKWLIEQNKERTDEYLGMIADHLENTGENVKAADYLLRAGKKAASQYANEEAIKYLTRASMILPEDRDEEHFKILFARVNIFSLKGNRTEEEKDLEELVLLSKKMGDDEKFGMVALLQARHASEYSNYPATINLAREAIRIGQAIVDPTLESEGHLYWGRALLSQGEYSEAKTHVESAHSISKKAKLIPVNADSLRYLGVIDEFFQNHESAVKYYEDSIELYRQSGDRAGEGRSLNHLGNILLSKGDLEGGKKYYDEFLEICREIGDRWGEGIVVRSIGDAYLKQSDFEQASSYFEKALEITREIGNKSVETGALIGLGNVFLEKSDYPKAKIHFDTSLRIAREIGNRPWEAKTLMQIGQFFHHLGDYLRARNYYDQSIEIFRELGNKSREGENLIFLGNLFNDLRDEDLAVLYAEKAMDISKELDNHSLRAQAFKIMGMASEIMGSSEDAMTAYQQSYELGQELGNSKLVIAALAGLARVSLLNNDSENAAQDIEKILEILETIPDNEVEDYYQVQMTCYRVMSAVDDTRAGEILMSAHERLEAQLDGIEDIEQKSSFLNNISIHKEVVKEYEKLKE